MPARRPKEIVARSLTVTGFDWRHFCIRPILDTLLAAVFGLTRDGVTLGAHAGLLDASQKWNDAEHAAMKKEIDAIYAEFTGVVKAARGLDDAGVDKVARGRESGSARRPKGAGSSTRPEAFLKPWPAPPARQKIMQFRIDSWCWKRGGVFPACRSRCLRGVASCVSNQSRSYERHSFLG